MSDMTTTYDIPLPPVEGADITYAGCGSHQLEITVHVEGDWNLDTFIQELVKAARDVCHHRPIDGQSLLIHPVCRFCDAQILPRESEHEGQQSWVLA